MSIWGKSSDFDHRSENDGEEHNPLLSEAIMATVTCAGYGDRTARDFRVQFDKGYAVLDLQCAIVRTYPKDFPWNPEDLTLYLARDADGEWLRNDQNLSRLLSKGVDERFPLLPHFMLLSDIFDGIACEGRHIHILVRLSTPPTAVLIRREYLFEQVVKTSLSFRHLPKTGEFLRLFEWSPDDCGTFKDMAAIRDVMGDFIPSQLYVRKEMLRVLSGFKEMYADVFDSGKITAQFVLLGSMGTGKSCLLALTCVYLAVKHSRPILWRGQSRDGGASLRLLYQRRYYEWMDPLGTKYLDIVGMTQNIDPWYFFDGRTEETILDEEDWRDAFTVLATYSPYVVYPAEQTKRCVLPFWRKKDIHAIGRQLELSKDKMAVRYFVSGGSLWAFMDERGRSVVQARTVRNIHDFDSNSLLRMYGMDDVNDMRAYVTCDRWRRCVTSRFAMQCLVRWAPLEYLRRQVELIQTTDDPVAQEIAMASQLHEAVFRRNKLSIHRCEYGCEDDGFRKCHPLVWNDVEDKSNANKLVHIEACKGSTVADREALVSTWASDPSVLDCWLPQTTWKGMPNAVLKWVPSKTGKPEIFMVRLTTTTMSRITQDLKKLVRLFQEKDLHVSFLVVVRDKATLNSFRSVSEKMVQQAQTIDIRVYICHLQ